MKRLLSAALVVFLLASVFSLFSCSPEEENKRPKSDIYYLYFDTECMITDYSGRSDADFKKMCDIVKEELARYHALLDIYHAHSGVVGLWDINESGGNSVQVSNELCDFLLYAKDIYTKTGGRVNIAMGSVLSLWHDRREAAKKPGAIPTLPDAAALAEAALHTDIDKLIIDRETSTVTLADPNMRLDAGALGKGYAARVIQNRLESLGYSSFILNLGGNVSASGVKADGTTFTAAIKNPSPTSSLDRNKALLTLRDASLSTSGDYERYYTVGGVDYHHIIDPDTLMPAERGFRSVTVMASDPSLSDALSTALFTLSLEDGRQLATELGVAVFWILDEGEVEYTDGFSFLNN